jgi:steroid delta-isomerase-like uncharacterized protein
MKKSILLLTKTTYVAAIILLMSFLILSCDQLCEKGITAEEAKALVEKDQKIWNEGDMAMVDEIIATDYVEHSAGIPQNDIVGIDAFKKRVTDLLSEFPDFNVTVEELIVKDDKIVWRWIVTGTNTGTLSDVPPTGKKMQFEGIGILYIVDGKIVERVMYYNQAAQLVQLGYTIAPPAIEVEVEVEVEE